MTNIKRQLAVTGLVASLALIGVSSARAFQSQQTAFVPAQAAVGGTKSASFTMSLRDITNTTAVETDIAWAGALPGGGWKVADTLVMLNYNVTDANGGIQVYTDNKNAVANPQFVDPTPTSPNNIDSNPAGLVFVPAAGTTSPTTLPVAWSIKDSTQVVGTQLQPADPNNGATTGPNNKFQWLYMLDKNTPAIDRNGNGVVTDTDPIANPNPNLRDTLPFANGDAFVTMIKQTGIHTGQGPTEYSPDADKTAFVYVQADFTTAAALSSYKASRLTVEAFIQ